MYSSWRSFFSESCVFCILWIIKWPPNQTHRFISSELYKTFKYIYRIGLFGRSRRKIVELVIALVWIDHLWCESEHGDTFLTNVEYFLQSLDFFFTTRASNRLVWTGNDLVAFQIMSSETLAEKMVLRIEASPCTLSCCGAVDFSFNWNIHMKTQSNCLISFADSHNEWFWSGQNIVNGSNIWHQIFNSLGSSNECPHASSHLHAYCNYYWKNWLNLENWETFLK